MIKQDNVLRFENLIKFENVIHGFSTRFFGDMRPSHHLYPQSLKKYTEALGISEQRLVRMDQVHSNAVAWVTKDDCGKEINETDGLVSTDLDIFLGVITADCIPFLLYDPKIKLVGAVHAGWRGLFSEIIKVAVSQMISQGSKPEDILVGIGPSIRSCCYSVSEEFVENFREKFGDVERFIVRRDGKIFFNLQKVAKEQLSAVGILEHNIEDADYCTFTHDDVYSCRREGKDFGEMMGIIGIRDK
jgi:polyphenol oxidase